jgi:hypothetical protein
MEQTHFIHFQYSNLKLSKPSEHAHIFQTDHAINEIKEIFCTLVFHILKLQHAGFCFKVKYKSLNIFCCERQLNGADRKMPFSRCGTKRIPLSSKATSAEIGPSFAALHYGGVSIRVNNAQPNIHVPYQFCTSYSNLATLFFFQN